MVKQLFEVGFKRARREDTTAAPALPGSAVSIISPSMDLKKYIAADDMEIACRIAKEAVGDAFHLSTCKRAGEVLLQEE